MYCGPLPQNDQEPTLLERLDQHPETISDEMLIFLMKTHEKSRGKNASIPAKCLMIWDKRHGKKTS